MKFIRDEEIRNLNGSDDLLKTNKYANTLKEVISNSRTPFTIGLFGEWGSGKSSIVNTAQNDLEQDSSKKIKFIKYDAWKYANDSFRRMFLKTVQNELNIEGTSDFEAFYVDKNTTTKISKKINTSFLLVSLVIILIGFSSVFLMANDTSLEWKITVPLLIVVIGISVSIARNFFDTYKVTVQNPKIFAPEQFEEIFDEIVDSALTKTTITKPQKWIQGEFKENKIDKLVIIIDNIDRCDKETAYELLTNIKNFLERNGIIFVVPIDDSALRRHLKDKNNEDKKEADEFLRKFFNVTLKIKYFQPTDLFQFTNHLNENHKLGLNPNTIDIISKEYATNPRRIIQMLNNLTTELNLIKNKMTEEFIKKNESLISVLLIIREEWIDLYKKIVIEPHILKEMKSDSNLQEEEKKFFQKAKTIIEKSNILSIERIVLNIDNNSLLPQEIIDYLEEEDYNSIKVSIEQKEVTFNNICEYTIEELNKEITRKTYETSVMSRFLNILNLNEIQALNEPNLVKIKNIIDSNLDNIMKNIEKENYKLLFKFSIHNKSEKLSYLYIYFKKNFNKAWGVEDISSDESVDNLNAYEQVIINGFSHFLKELKSSEIDNTLSKIFQNYYSYHNNKNNYYIKQEEIDINILKKLKFDLVCPYLIDKLNFTINNQVDANDYLNDNYNELKFIMDNSLVSLREVENIFDKFNFNMPAFAVNNDVVKKSLTKIIADFLDNMTSSISNLKAKKYNSTIVSNFINKLNSNNQFIYNNNGGYRDNFSLINEVTRDISYQKTLLKFYIEIYDTALNSTKVSDEIVNLVSKYPNITNDFYEELARLNKINNSVLVRIFDNNIFNDTNYNNELLLDLLKIVFLDKNNKDEDIEKISNKLNSILRYLLSPEDNKKEYAFIEELLSNEKIKGLVSNEILKFEFQEILEFNSSIRRLAYDDFVEKSKVFELENSVLIDMIETDEEKYKNEVIKVIKTYIPDKSKTIKGLELLDKLTLLSNEEKTFFKTELLEHKDDKDLKEHVEDHCKRLEAS